MLTYDTQAEECTMYAGVAHASTTEDAYKGMRIPKGATLMVNIWYGHADCYRHLISP